MNIVFNTNDCLNDIYVHDIYYVFDIHITYTMCDVYLTAYNAFDKYLIYIRVIYI